MKRCSLCGKKICFRIKKKETFFFASNITFMEELRSMASRLSRVTSEDLTHNSLMYYIQPLAGVLDEYLPNFNPNERIGMGHSNTVSLRDALHAAGVSGSAQTEIWAILDHLRILRLHSEMGRTMIGSPRLIRQPIYIEDVNIRWWAGLLLEYVMRPA